MSIIELLVLAVGLSMDAVAVAICKGFSMREITPGKTRVVGLYFGIFQGGMPLVGYFLARGFQNHIEAFDHWIAFILLGVIGINMILQSGKEDGEDGCPGDGPKKNDLAPRTMVVLAIATSIDALAVGITLTCLKVNILLAASLIGGMAYILSRIGVSLGYRFGEKYKTKIEKAGGVTLLLMGLKILLEHIGIINF